MALVNNLTGIQSNNSQIEHDTIERLLLVEKFGEDANDGLDIAIQQNNTLVKDLKSQ